MVKSRRPVIGKGFFNVLLIIYKFTLVYFSEIIHELNQIQHNLVNQENELKEIVALLDLCSYDTAICGRHTIEHVLKEFKSRLETESNLNEIELRKLQMAVSGYYGQLIDCFELTKPIHHALEGLLKNKIFNHIVDNEEVAIILLGEISKKKLPGTFNFLALNRLTVKDSYLNISECDSNCQPIVSCMNLSHPHLEKVELAIHSQCQGLYIVKSFDFGISMNETSKNCDFCTLNGEMIDRFGVITRVSCRNQTRYELHEKWRTLNNNVLDSKGKLEKLENEKDFIVKQITLFESEIAKIKCYLNEYKQNKLNNEKSDENVKFMKRVYQLDDQIHFVKQLLDQIESKLSCLLEKQHFWQSKLDSLEFLSSTEQKHLLEDLSSQINLIKIEYSSVVKVCKNTNFNFWFL